MRLRQRWPQNLRETHNSVLFLHTSKSQLHDSSHTSLQKILNTPAGCQVSGNLICTWWTSGKPKNRLPMMSVKLLPIGFKGWPSDMKRQQPDAFLGGHPSYWLLELIWIHRECVCICIYIYIYINQPGPTTKTCSIVYSHQVSKYWLIYLIWCVVIHNDIYTNFVLNTNV